MKNHLIRDDVIARDFSNFQKAAATKGVRPMIDCNPLPEPFLAG